MKRSYQVALIAGLGQRGSSPKRDRARFAYSYIIQFFLLLDGSAEGGSNTRLPKMWPALKTILIHITVD